MEATVTRLVSLIRILSLRNRPTTALLGSSATLGLLTLLLSFIFRRQEVVTHLISDGACVGRRLKRDEGEYDPNEYDVVIVGGGTAGCVLAARISEDPSIRVLLLEAGESSQKKKAVQVPIMCNKVFHTRHDYDLYTVAQTSAGSKAKFWPRAKLLGGCSTINAMIFQQGAPSDYDEWVVYQKDQEGASGWSYQELHPYFLKFENFHPSKRVPTVDISRRGSTGPVKTGFFGNASQGSVNFVDACDKVGVPRVADVNTAEGTLGAAPTMTFIDPHGHRVTMESAYLTPNVLARPNLKVATKVQVTRILFETSGSGGDESPRATGVLFSDRKGESFEVKARKEVIVSAGAVHTPQILMLSGVGPATHLAEHGISVIADLPGVGSHLMDHPVADLHFKDKSGTSLAGLNKPSTIAERLSLLKAVWDYEVFGTGPLTCNVAEAVAFMRSDDPKLFPPDSFPPAQIQDLTSGPNGPDLELFFSPAGWTDHGYGPFPSGPHITIHAVLLRPSSTGTIRLRSSDPSDSPIIDPRYLSSENDLAVLVRGARLISQISRTEPFASMLDPTGDDDTFLSHGLHKLDDAAVAQRIRECLETLYHPACTARMAPLEDGGVVDPFLRVHGISNLRVVDASIFPTIVSGHTASPVIAVAEKAADLVKIALQAKE
ncbi:GMC oxidoreductase [Amylocystis lapponica]|nr:GMC oxidoreductase [Amylocystis lapponica]